MADYHRETTLVPLPSPASPEPNPMSEWTHYLVRYFVLTVVTIFAIGVMVWVTIKDDSAAQRAKEQLTTPLPVVSQPKPLVAVAPVEATLCEVTTKFSGKLRPWETYSLGFEQAGKIVELGTDANGNPLDDGSRVEAGQMLARIDDRILRAQAAEASANLEQASSDLSRAREVRAGGFGGITEAEYQEALTQEALAKAALEIATKNLQDAVLYSPVDATISRRLSEPGETVNGRTTVFELVQNDDLLLVVDVPESRVGELERRSAMVREAQTSNSADAEARVFRARVQLESRDRFGRKFPPIDAQVHRIAELADTRTGLFEVEVKVPNPDHLLRPGMVATAEVVIDRISAYQLPESAVLFRGDQTYVFSLEQKAEPLRVMFWDFDQLYLPIAHKVLLDEWIDQGKHLLIPASQVELKQIVVRGHQRLTDGQHVRVSDSDKQPASQVATSRAAETDAEPSSR